MALPRLLTGLTLALPVAALVGCVGAGLNYDVQCMGEIKPQGSYTYPAASAVPTVRPGPGGTVQGAAALNTCIGSKAAAAGKAVSPVPASSRQIYTISTNGNTVVRHYSFGRKRVTAASESAPLSYDGSSCRGGLEMTGGTAYSCRTGGWF